MCAMTVRWRVLGAVLIGGALIAPAAVANEAAHSLAEKFAEDTAATSKPSAATRRSGDRDGATLERKLQEEERLRADEAEMLERAKAEDAERRAADAKAEADAKAAAERAAAERAEADRVAAEAAAAAKLAEQQHKAREDEEADKAARERAARETARIKAAEDRRKAAEDQANRKLAEEKAEAERQAEARKLAQEKAEADRREAEAARARIAAAKEADDQRRMEAEREAEAKRLSEKLQRAREQRAAKDLGQGYSALGAPMPEHAPPALPNRSAAPAAPKQAASRRGVAEASTGDDNARATILLVMEPGNRGIRRHEKTGDPIVCSGSTCFISEGAERPAKAMPRGRAFGAGNTLGGRAGACRHALACIFRGIDVGSETFALQAVDMRILRHDRREQVTVDVDHTCRLTGNRLQCAEPVDAGSYRAWIVPEKLARKAGPDALLSALEAGLPPPPVAARDWR